MGLDRNVEGQSAVKVEREGTELYLFIWDPQKKNLCINKTQHYVFTVWVLVLTDTQRDVDRFSWSNFKWMVYYLDSVPGGM